MNTTPEEWRPVVGYEGLYEVSNLGRARSLDRLVASGYGSTRQAVGRLLKPMTDSHGYIYVTLSSNAVATRGHIHLMVLQAFVGPRPEGLVACHYDDDKSNNTLQNLRWDTQAANIFDQFRNNGRRQAVLSSAHCFHGHELTEGNIKSNGKYHCCKTCALRRQREYRARQKAKQHH
jgi:hypothetical protein